MTENIFPDRDKFLERPAKEKLLNQHGLVIWFTGLSASGKSTLAIALERKLYREGLLTQVLDGDKIRNGLNSNLGFTIWAKIFKDPFLSQFRHPFYKLMGKHYS